MPIFIIYVLNLFTARKSAAPLDLASFAGYEKLTDKEREVFIVSKIRKRINTDASCIQAL